MKTHREKEERIGELFILSKLPIVGILPILINYTTKLMPPLLFAGASALIAAILLIPYLVFTKQIWKIFDRKVFPYLLGVTLFIIIVPLSFIYVGSSKTSSINTTLLLQTELFFTFIVCGAFEVAPFWRIKCLASLRLGLFGEKITPQRIIGGVAILAGASIVLFKETLTPNLGDLLIITGTMFYPIGNIFAKKALGMTSASVIIFVRSFLGGLTLVGLSFLFEKYALSMRDYIVRDILFILINGILLQLVSKILWYQGLKRIDITKAVSIGIAMPVFSLLYAFLFLKEVPTLTQWIGFFAILMGLFVITRKKTEVVEIT